MAVYTTINDGTAYFQTSTYDGNGSDDRNITYDGNSNMQPDFLWFKRRNQAVNHILFDSTRGVTSRIHSNNTNAAAIEANFLQAFNSDGFQVGTDADINGSGGTFVSWGWKANGGTTASNTAGSITSTVQANTTSGFSVVTYTGTQANATVGHGLGVAPKCIISKCISSSNGWPIYHYSLTATDFIRLNSTNGTSDNAAVWNDTEPTSTVFSIGANDENNKSSATQLAYCFAEKQGYSKFGSYTGNANADGPFAYTGFKPAFLIIKNTSDSDDQWLMWDNKRSPTNPVDDYLEPSTNSAEYANSNWAIIDFVSNGFKLRSSDISYNQSGYKYIYMAFAESPFTTSDGVPTTAR